MNNAIKAIQKIGFQWVTESPFIITMHHEDHYPAGDKNQGPAVSLAGRSLGQDFSGKDGFSMYHGEVVPGFPEHPHRGFETVTIVLEGIVDHFDSMGLKGRYGNGDVQWLTTGKGCQHAEMFPLIHNHKDNPLELFQIWLNLPAKNKFAEPDYKMLWAEDIPVFTRENEEGQAVKLRLIAGSFDGVESLAPAKASWANDKENHVGILLIEMEPMSCINLPAVSQTLNRNLYFYRGKGTIQIDDKSIPSSNRIQLQGGEEVLIKNGEEKSYLLLLEGEPINEPVAQYGPFVMNTQEEIQQAYYDYEKTGFGGWPWDRFDPVHDREEGRFALYPDGSIVRR